MPKQPPEASCKLITREALRLPIFVPLRLEASYTTILEHQKDVSACHEEQVLSYQTSCS